MTDQGDLKPTTFSDMSLSRPSPGSPGEARSNVHSAEQIAKNSHKRFLTHREAAAGCPDDGAACGEEDPGVALELLVAEINNKDRK